MIFCICMYTCHFGGQRYVRGQHCLRLMHARHQTMMTELSQTGISPLSKFCRCSLQSYLKLKEPLSHAFACFLFNYQKIPGRSKNMKYSKYIH